MAKGQPFSSFGMAAIVLAQGALLAAILLYAADGLSPFEIAGITASVSALTCLAMWAASKPSPAAAGMPEVQPDRSVPQPLADLKEIAAQAYELERLSGGHIARIVETAAIETNRQDDEPKTGLEDMGEEGDRNIGPLRIVVGALDAGLRRFASGDLSVRLDQPFPEEFEGMRADFNRALTAVEDVLSDVGADAHGLHTHCETTKDGFLHAADTGARQAAALARIIAEANTLSEALRARRMQTAHTATIAHNAEADMRRPKDAIAAALATARALRQTSLAMEPAARIIRDVAFQANMIAVDAAAWQAGTKAAGTAATDIRALGERAAAAATDISLLARTSAESAETTARSVEKAQCEIEAIGIYAAALKDHVEVIAASSSEEIETTATIRITLMAIGKAGHEQIAALDDLAGRLGGLQRQAEALDSHVRRSAPSAEIAPHALPQENRRPENHGPENNRSGKPHPHLRLVKS